MSTSPVEHYILYNRQPCGVLLQCERQDFFLDRPAQAGWRTLAPGNTVWIVRVREMSDATLLSLTTSAPQHWTLVFANGLRAFMGLLIGGEFEDADRHTMVLLIVEMPAPGREE